VRAVILHPMALGIERRADPVEEAMNGAAQSRPLDGWVIVLGGRTLIGLLDARGVFVEPVYELQAQIVQQGQQMGIAHQVLPVMLLASVRRIKLPIERTVIECETLSVPERRSIWAAVQRCEEMIGQMRAADAGLTVVPAGARLPPLDLRHGPRKR